MADTKCVFCRLVEDTSVKNYENDLFYAIFDSFPVSPGHSLIIPKRHVVNLSGLNSDEWTLLKKSLLELISLIENTDLKKIYEAKVEESISNISIWFCKKALSHPRINSKPDAYNHGLNDGKAAGRTVNHLHWHIIPRYEGDVEDPRGGVKYVIQKLGNYKIKRDKND
jgi:histidine triad (HIT) family protein